MNTFEHLEKWTLASCYVGAHWDDYYVFLRQNRDSDTLTRCNFIEGLRRLGGESNTVKIIRESHWAVGWVEWIAIHESDSNSLELADKMLKEIDNYPILNEDKFSEMEHDEYSEIWNNHYKDDFSEGLFFKFKLKARTSKFLQKHDLLQCLYEKGIPSGEYYDNDNSGISCWIEGSLECLTRDDIASFIKEWKTYFKNKSNN